MTLIARCRSRIEQRIQRPAAIPHAVGEGRQLNGSPPLQWQGISRLALPALLLLSACSQRHCGGGSEIPGAGTRVELPGASTRAPAERARCNREIARGAVATVPGLGALDALAPVCAGDAIAVYAVRGHTLSRLVRPLAPGSTFHLADPIATGADRLGPVGLGNANGPLAWRSPTVLLDENVGDEWWVAWLEDSADGGVRVHRGSALVQPGGEGIGTIVPIARHDNGVEVLATIAREGSNPQLVRATVPTDGEELLRFTHDPPSLGEGEIKAWEASTRTVIVFAVTEDGGGVLRIARVDDTPGEGMHSRGEVRLSRSHVIVTPVGIPLANGEVLFAYSEFDVVQRGHGTCLALDPTLCVQPGPVRMLRIDAANTIRTTDLAPAGLIDTMAIEHDQSVLAFYVGAVGETRAQHAMRFDAATGAISRAPLEPSDDIPPLDRPALVRCGDEAWLAAEVVVEPGDAGHASETAVMVVPANCVVR